MSLAIYQIDAFTDRLFRGNPAAVVPLARWLPETLMQSIAAENQLSETAFFVPTESGYHLRWFTPTTEVELCGHATLASAWVLFHRLIPEAQEIHFSTEKAGPLIVRRDDPWIELDFPALLTMPREAPPGMVDAMGADPEFVAEVDDRWLFVYASEAEVRDLSPDFAALAGFPRQGVIATAPGEDEDCDFVSRFFVPSCGVDEDPVTGSAHCVLTPYWCSRFGVLDLSARQISERGGTLQCRYVDDRVRIRGQAVSYLEGLIDLPEA